MSEATLSVDQNETRRSPARAGLVARLAKRAALAALPRLAEGRLVVHLPDGSVHEAGAPDALPHASIWIDDDRFFREYALRGDIGAGEAYMEGWWRADDLPVFLELALRNEQAIPQTSWLTKLLNVPRDVGHLLRPNTRQGSRRNISAHYDLSNELFALFLDETMTYSAGVHAEDDPSLEVAQRRKFDRLCDALALGADDHVLEIGCGWGGFALHAATTRGCRVTAITVSQAQHEFTQARVAAHGLADRIDVRLCDYRDVTGTYSAIVSIEMLEAVGRAHWPTFFEICDARLARGGQVAIQTIAMPDHRFEEYARHADWIQTYIFPGGMLPSTGELCRAAAASTSFGIRALHDIGPHYATTLAEWRTRFFERIDEVHALGFDARFVRMWDYYLSSCEAMFRTRFISNLHLTFGRTSE